MNLFKTIKTRLFSSFAVFAVLMVAVALIAVTVFSEFGSVTRTFISESLPEIEEAYALENIAHDVSIAGPLMAATLNADSLRLIYEESKVNIKKLHSLTATLSAKGIYGDLLSLNRHSQGLLSNLNMILAIKTKLLELQSEFDRSMANAANLFKEASSEEFYTVYHQLFELPAIKTEADVAQLQNRYLERLKVLAPSISNGSTEQVGALLKNAVVPFSIRKEQLRLNSIVMSSLARLKTSTDGIYDNALHYRQEVSKSANKGAASVLQLESKGTIAIVGLSALMFCLAVLVGWLVVAKGIVARLSALSALMLRDPKQVKSPATTITGDDEIGDMGRAVETFLENSNALVLAQTALDQTEDCVFMFKPDTLAFFYVNEGAAKQLGYSRDELLRMTPIELKPLFTEDTFRDFLSPLLSNDVSSLTFETLHRHKDGHDIPVEILVQNIHLENSPSFLMAIVRDISRKLQAEQELRESKQDAEHAQKTAEQANQAKSEFLSSMSHELRTPLNAILGFAQVLELNPKEPLSEKQKDATNQIKIGGTHLLDLINDVLNLAKIESGHLDVTIQAVNIQEIVDKCMSVVEPLTHELGLTINTDGIKTALVLADQVRFKQILLNLISNAVKYNRQGGMVSLRSSAVEGGMHRISIVDTGYGIPVEKYDELFRPFNRLGAENSTIEGTGIGLTITKRLLESMGGRIGLESTEGVGSTFWIELPLAEQQPVTEPMTKETGENNDVANETIGKILYIEDNEANIILMESILNNLTGIELNVERTAEQGVVAAIQNRPNLILMDIGLPAMNGNEALDELRRREETRDIPVIAISANAMPNEVKLGLKAGFLAYLTKPFDVTELINTISDVLLKEKK